MEQTSATMLEAITATSLSSRICALVCSAMISRRRRRSSRGPPAADIFKSFGSASATTMLASGLFNEVADDLPLVLFLVHRHGFDRPLLVLEGGVELNDCVMPVRHAGKGAGRG